MINWFNTNQGFMSAILAFATITISVVAVLISVKTAKVKNRIDLFNKRVELFNDFQDLSILIYNCYINSESIKEFKEFLITEMGIVDKNKDSISYNYLHKMKNVENVHLLFDKSISKHIWEWIELVNEITFFMQGMNSNTYSVDFNLVMESKDEYIEFYEKTAKIIIDKMRKVVDLSKK